MASGGSKSLSRLISLIGSISGLMFVGANVHAHLPNINDHTSVIPFIVEGGTGDSAASTASATSGDGRFVVFSSFASDLVPVDNNGQEDVFLFDRQNGTLLLVSRNSEGAAGNGPSKSAVISADGNSIAFVSSATNLYVDNNGAVQDVVVYNRLSKTFEVVNRNDPGDQSQLPANNPALSADGRFVAFDSAEALVAEATQGIRGVYVRDRFSNTTQLVSRTPDGAFPNGESTDPAISADGSLVAYASRATDIAAGAAEVANIYYIDRNSLITELVTANGNADSLNPAISGNGAFVAYQSEADSISDQDFNTASDVFVWEAATGTVTLVSRQASGESANGFSLEPVLNEDGSSVVYLSTANNIVDGDSNGVADAFLLNRTTGLTTRVNVAEDGTQADLEAFNPSLSADGNTVVFWSSATTLTTLDAANHSDVLIRNLGLAVPQPMILSSVLPSSRATEVDQTVTVFATMVASDIGSECRIELASPIDASIFYQRTDPTTNELIGEPNVPVYLRPNVPQSFAIGITAFAPLEPQEIEFAYVCSTGNPADVFVATNTVLFSASEQPTLDIVAAVATINNDGIVNIPDSENFGIFSAANVNVGSAGNVTASVAVLGQQLDEVLICPTNFITGACIDTPGQSTLAFQDENGTASFGIFVRNSTPVEFRPDVNRLALVFTDDEGVVRGRTSVAVRSN